MQHPPTSFEGFGLDERLVAAVSALGFDAPPPIQAHAIPPLCEGRDVIGRARTGSGKTAAFALPMLQRVADGPTGVKALVLAPTRELALQVTEAVRSYAKQLPVKVVTLYGGAAYQPQLAALSRGVPVVIGTPGRVLDHVERGTLDLSGLELLVLDEADEMLRMGFLEDVERVLEASPDGRQIALFSATMPPPIRRIATAHLREPLIVQVESGELTTDHIEQRGLIVPQRFKLDALSRLLRAEPRGAKLVFARTRAGCAETAAHLAERGFAVEALHGDLNQGARELVVTRLRAQRLDVVVATDVAARGLDVEHLTHVVNLDLPNDVETYVHRIGRTGRAGRDGVAISLVTPREGPLMRRLERSLKVKIEKIEAPSDADIVRRQREEIVKEVASLEVADPHLELADELLASELAAGREPRELLAAALSALAAERGFDPAKKVAEGPPAWSRRVRNDVRSDVRSDVRHEGRSQGEFRPRPPREDAADEVEIFLPVGRQRGVRPADIVGALANELGIPGTRIGRITIGGNKSFVRLPREIGETILEERAGLEVRGVQVPLSRARHRPPAEHPHGNARPKPFRPGKPGKFKKPKNARGHGRPTKPIRQP